QLDSNGQPLKLYTAPPLWGPAPLAYQGLAFAALHAKWRITKVEHGFGLALGVQVGDGFSDAAASAGADSGFWYWPQLILEKRLGPKGEFRIAVNAGYRGHSATQTVMPLREGKYADGSLVTYGGGVSLRILE